MSRTPQMPDHDAANFITFDTHKYIKELEASGFPEQQAEVLIKSMLAARYYDVSQLATREQVEKLEKELKMELKGFKEELKGFKGELKGFKEELKNFATREQLHAEIATVKYDILKWIIPMFLGMMGMMVSIFLKLH